MSAPRLTKKQIRHRRNQKRKTRKLRFR